MQLGKSFFKVVFFLLIIGSGLLALSMIVSNSRQIFFARHIVKDWSRAQKSYSPSQRVVIIAEARRRSALYETQIQARHLVNGMVVNRNLDGVATSVCDSLLFSGIRYVALKKLGFHLSAANAWDAIVASRENDGRFLRHPLCKNPMSRDMFIGVLIALTQSPPESETILRDTINRLATNVGFFDDGPLYLSYLTPGLTEAVRKLSIAHGLTWPGRSHLIDYGFSTVELNSMYLDDDFRAHLVALVAWLEGESKELYQRRGMVTDHKSPTFEVSKALTGFTMAPIYEQRLGWVATKLLNLNGKNLFYRLLYLDSNGGLTETTALTMLEELLTMRQFPSGHLPMNCDRGADYLWQRQAAEYAADSVNCSEEYAGVDFLWMAALLLEKIEGFADF